MATLSLLAAIIACFSRLLQGLLVIMTVANNCVQIISFLHVAASEVEFKEAGEIEVDLGERLTLICSASSLYDIELLQIGEILTVEEKIAYNTSQHGNPSMHYDPEGCQRSVEAVLCSKIYSITVTGNMHGRSYQCLVSDNDDTYYSQGGYVRGMVATAAVFMDSIPLPLYLSYCS